MADLYAIQNVHSFLDRMDFVTIKIGRALFDSVKSSTDRKLRLDP